MPTSPDAVILIGAPHDRAALREAAGAVGAIVVAEYDWESAPLAGADDAHLIVAALDDLAEDELTDALARRLIASAFPE